MRRFSINLFLLLIFIFPGITAQESTEPVRDAEAVAAVEAAIAVLGGQGVLGLINESVAEGTVTPAPDSPARPGQFVWKISGKEFRREYHRDGKQQIFFSGHGSPAVSRDGQVSRMNYHMVRANLPFHFPGLVLLKQLKNKDYSITLAAPTTIAGRPAIHVHMKSDADPIASLITPQDWYFDAVTGLPLRVEHRLPSNKDAGRYSIGATDYANFQNVDGIMIPFQLTYHIDEKALATATITSIRMNPGLSSTEFDVPTGGGQ